MSDDNHRELAEVLHSINGMALVSGYNCDLYEELYADWTRVVKTSRVNGAGSAVESLWLSPKLVEQKGLMLF
jgi:DNA adenine methylase